MSYRSSVSLFKRVARFPVSVLSEDSKQDLHASYGTTQHTHSHKHTHTKKQTP